MANYTDLLNVDSKLGEKKITFNDDRGGVGFYCKDCEALVETTRLDPEKYIYECNVCKGNNLSIGTIEGLKENYRIK